MKNSIEVPFYEFRAGTFHSTIDENRHAYTALYELVSDTEFLEIYLAKKDEQFRDNVAKEKLPHELENDARELNRLSKQLGLMEATVIFNRQSLVVFVTIVESMLDEFFVCVFCSAPEKMYEYIQTDVEGKVRGKIDIKEVINSSSRTELLLSLAKQAASKAMQGGFKAAINRLKKLTIGEEFSKDLSDRIDEITETRNRIVHELADIEVRFDDVKQAFDTAFELVEYMEKVAKRLGIPVMEISAEDEESD